MPSSFEDLVVFQRAVELMVMVYRETEGFPSRELYGLTGQIRRAAVSVVSNIAEAQGRLTAGESRLFLSHARGSLFEVDAQLIASKHLGYLPDAPYEELRRQVTQTAKPLAGLIDHVRRRERKSRRPRPRLPSTVHP